MIFAIHWLTCWAGWRQEAGILLGLPLTGYIHGKLSQKQNSQDMDRHSGRACRNPKQLPHSLPTMPTLDCLWVFELLVHHISMPFLSIISYLCLLPFFHFFLSCEVVFCCDQQNSFFLIAHFSRVGKNYCGLSLVSQCFNDAWFFCLCFSKQPVLDTFPLWLLPWRWALSPSLFLRMPWS